MALNIPSYPNPFDPATPLVNSYAWISFLALDLFAENGRFQLNVNPTAASWQASPLSTISLTTGQVVVPANPPVAAISILTLAELLAETTTIGTTGLTFAQAYAAIGQRLYAESLKLPLLSAATQV